MFLLCDYETSVMLKDMGFNGTCEYCYDTRNGNPVERQTTTDVFGKGKHNSSDPYLVSAPFLMDAVEWIREEYGVRMCAHKLPNLPIYSFTCTGLPYPTDGVAYTNSDRCLDSAIKYTLKILSHDRK